MSADGPRGGGGAAISAALAAWERLWGVPGLADGVTIAFSTRLRRTLGRASPATGRVVLHAGLRDAPPERLLPVLCHEVAHVAAFRLARAANAGRPVPHGAGWSALVRAAGYEPAVRAPRPPELAPPVPMPPAPSRLRVAHVCPVCQARRLARRAVPAWRCAACRALGLEGRMDVVRLPPADK